jgi:hypothetical protein
MSGVLPIIVIGLMIATLLVMIGGIFIMAKGGEANQKHGNKLMTLRVTLQALTLISFAILILLKA